MQVVGDRVVWSALGDGAPVLVLAAPVEKVGPRLVHALTAEDVDDAGLDVDTAPDRLDDVRSGRGVTAGAAGDELGDAPVLEATSPALPPPDAGAVTVAPPLLPRPRWVEERLALPLVGHRREQGNTPRNGRIHQLSNE